MRNRRQYETDGKSNSSADEIPDTHTAIVSDSVFIGYKNGQAFLCPACLIENIIARIENNACLSGSRRYHFQGTPPSEQFIITKTWSNVNP
jgi:hypothetical protein